MTQYYAIITDIGNAQIANAIALGKTISLTHMAVGDANGNQILPIPTQKSLVHETYRAQINSLTIDEENPNVVIAEFIIPEDIGGFYVRELGVFDNTGNLIAVGNTPESYKPKMTEGSGAQKVMRMHLVTSASDKIELKINPSIVVATIDLVNKKVDEINKTIATKADKNHNHDADYAPKTHNHDTAYAPKTHSHSDYALNSHNHDADYAPKTHNHDTAYAPKTHSHSDYALNSHNHDTNYAPKMHTHDYAAPNHTHSDLAKIDASNITVASYLQKLGLKDSNIQQNGWVKLPCGLILQFFNGPMAKTENDLYPEISLPIAFPTACLNVLVSTNGNNTIYSDQIFQVSGFTKNTVKLFAQYFATGTQGIVYPTVFAIGY